MALFVPLDVEYDSDDKVIMAGPLAELLYVRGLAFCKRTMSNGNITRAQLAVVGRSIPSALKQADRLVELGLWVATPTGWLVASWLKRNKSSQQIEADKAKKKAASVQANHKRWHVEGGDPSPTCPLCNPEPDAKPDAKWHPKGEGEPEGEGKGEEEPLPTDSPDGSNPPSPDAACRRDLIILAYTNIAVMRSTTDIGNPEAWREGVRKKITTNPDLDRLAAMFPTAPADAVAAWLHGDKGSMRYYPRRDELATVTELRPA